MSADQHTPLFEISDRDDLEYVDDPAVMQVKENLVMAEHIQQEKAEQRRLEMEERKVWVEAERLMQEIEEAERQWRELEEVEVERLEEEKRTEQRCVAMLWGSERAASLPEAGPSRAPPQKPERTMKGAHRGPGIIIPSKNCAWCIAQESLCLWDPEGHARSCQLC